MILKTPSEILHSFHGGKSSKRFWGCRLLTIGVYLSLILFVINLASSFFGTIDNQVNELCKDLIWMFFGTGGGLLFGGVFESYGK